MGNIMKAYIEIQWDYCDASDFKRGTTEAFWSPNTINEVEAAIFSKFR